MHNHRNLSLGFSVLSSQVFQCVYIFLIIRLVVKYNKESLMNLSPKKKLINLFEACFNSKRRSRKRSEEIEMSNGKIMGNRRGALNMWAYGFKRFLKQQPSSIFTEGGDMKTNPPPYQLQTKIDEILKSLSCNLLNHQLDHQDDNKVKHWS